MYPRLMRFNHWLAKKAVDCQRRFQQKGPIFGLPCLFTSVILEIILNLVSLPMYLRQSYQHDPTLFNADGYAYCHYRARRRLTISGLVSALAVVTLYLAFSAIFSFYRVNFVKAAVVTWDGGGGDGVWATCTNWSGDACPGTSDIATFDSTNTGNVSINADISVAGIDINSGYTGTITQNAAITIGSSNYDQAAGTFVGGTGANNIDVNGTFTHSAGTFTATRGTIYVTGNFNQTGGTFTSAGGTIEFDGSAATLIDLNSSLTVASTTINRTGSGAIFLNTNDTLVTTGTFYLQDGTFNDTNGGSPVWEVQDCSKFKIDTTWSGGNTSNQVYISGGTGTVTSSNSQVWPDFRLNAANCTVNASGTGTTQFDNRFDLDAGTFNANSSTILIDSTTDISGGSYVGGSGNDIFTGTYNQSGGTFDLGGSDQTTGGGVTFLSTYTLSGGTTTMRFNTSTDFNGNFSQSNGVFIAPTTTAYFAANFTQTGGTFTSAGGTIEFDGSAATLIDLNSSLTVASTTINRTGSGAIFLNTNDTLVTTGTLSFKSGTFNDTNGGSPVWEAQGDVYGSANFSSDNSQALQITGTANQRFYGDATPSSGDFPPITINKTGGTLTFGMGSNSTTMRINAGNFTYTAGTIDPASSTWYFAGAMTLDAQSATVTSSFNNIAFPSGVVTLGGDLDVEGKLSIEGGTLKANGKNISVYGNWVQNSGQFIHDLATTTFDGVNQSISASTTFYHFQKTSSTRAILTLPASVTTTFAGNLIWEGAASNLLSVSSSISGTKTNINPRGTRRISYVSVADNVNDHATAMPASNGTSVNGGNNTNWDFGNDAPTVSISSAVQKKDGTGIVDVAISFDDANDDNTGQAKMAYKSGTDCSSGTSDPTLDETDANTSATTGDPKTENDNTYQVGNASGYILTSSGANTVNFDWLSDTDVSTANGTYCIQITPTDGTDAGTAVNTTLTLDNVTPTAPGNLTLSSAAATSLTLTYGSAGSDTNFDEYLLHYKAGSSGVTSYNNRISSTTDSNLDSVSYGGATTVAVSNLSPNTQYVANLWIVDTYGNSTTAATELAAYTAAAVPTSPTTTINGLESITVSWSANGNPAGTEYNVQITSGDTGESGWITNTTYTFKKDFKEGTSYGFTIKARNTSGTETSTVTAGGGTPRSGARPAINFQPRPSLSSGGQPLVPMLINNGAASTPVRGVTLNFNLRDVSMVAVSNYLHFPDRVFVPYVPTMRWELLPGSGQKTVYAKFLALDQQTIVEYQDAIELLAPAPAAPLPAPLPPVPPPTPSTTARSTAPAPDRASSTPLADRPIIKPVIPLPAPIAAICSLTINAPYRAERHPGVFMILPGCVRRAFTGPTVFFSHFESFSEIQTLSTAPDQNIQPAAGLDPLDYTGSLLDAVPLDRPAVMPIGPRIRLQNMDLVQVIGSPRVYYLENNQLRWIISEFVFNELKFDWSAILPILPTQFNSLPLGHNLTEADIGPFLQDFVFNSEHEDIRQISLLLQRLDYTVDLHPNRYFNSLLETALKKFQADYGLPQTGQIDRATRAKLNVLYREQRGV